MAFAPATPPPPFDHAAAVDAAVALRRLAAEIDSHALRRAHLAAAARHGWAGAHRREFDVESRRHERTASELAADLRRLAGQVDAESETVRRARAAAAAASMLPGS